MRAGTVHRIDIHRIPRGHCEPHTPVRPRPPLRVGDPAQPPKCIMIGTEEHVWEIGRRLPGDRPCEDVSFPRAEVHAGYVDGALGSEVAGLIDLECIGAVLITGVLENSGDAGIDWYTFLRERGGVVAWRFVL